ncbi:hypothetical protein CDAR_279861 [Caerostris darwini]|uniref:Uncharacterized protein n=1 Tax=Caerostris darwini TaxID=1538125 RepID=A0AAV4QRS8_9ARAC|nr:hypothetical protein CDAR_279861 [Caerostris darwini]
MVISKDRVLRKEYSHRNDATRFIRSRITTMSPASRPTIAGTPMTAQLSSWLFTSWWPCLLFPAFFMTLCYICVIRELWSSTRTVAAMTRPTE